MRRQSLIPPIIVDLTYQAVSGVAGVQFTDATPCPVCQVMPMSHDLKRRRFSTVTENDQTVHIYVFIKRFYCPKCGKLCYADAPFYEKSRFGSPVVDLCITLSKDHSFSETAKIMNRMGIVIDRGTVRKTVLSHHHEVDAADFFGIKIPQSIITLSTLVTGNDPAGSLTGKDVLRACRKSE